MARAEQGSGRNQFAEDRSRREGVARRHTDLLEAATVRRQHLDPCVNDARLRQRLPGLHLLAFADEPAVKVGTAARLQGLPLGGVECVAGHGAGWGEVIWPPAYEAGMATA